MDQYRSSQNNSQDGLPPRPSTAPKPSSDMSQRPQVPHPVVTDVKPRLTKEQHDILEAHFQQQHKPSTNTKKGFAETLGVPLDKINNWFQNRRAKVKQDLKKQMAAYNLYQQGSLPGGMPAPMPLSMPISVQQQQYPTADFFGTPASLSMEHLAQPQPVSQIAQQQFALHPDFSTQSLASINESNQHGSFQDVIASMMAAGYNIPEQNPAPTFMVDSGYSDESQFGFGPTVTVGQENFDDTFVFSDFTGYDLNSYGSTSMQAMNSRDSLSSKPSTSGAQSMATTASSNPVSSATSGCSPLADDNQDCASNGFTESREDSTEPRDFPMMNRKTLSTSSSHTSLPQWAANQHSIYQQQNGSSSQTLLYSPLDANADLEPPPVMGENGVYTRRNSSTSNLVENLRQIGIQSRGSVESFTQTSAPLSIAARRQRHPAALGAAALRSASYTSGMPISPSANQALNAEHSLRRIRSSGIANGRVTKSTPTSTQRSPLALSFAEAAARQFSATPVTTTANGALAPPTPLTPSELVGHNGMIRCQYPSGDVSSPPDSLGLCWSADQSSAGVYSTMGSPPKTPLDAVGMNHIKLLQHNAALAKDNPPLSAPATQLNFPRHMQMSSQYSIDSIPTSDYASNAARLAHIRKASLPDGGNASTISSLQFGLALNATSAASQNALSQTKTDMMNQYMAALTGQDISSTLAPTGDNLNAPADLNALYGQEFPSQALAQHMSNADPNHSKNYVFANQGPKDYQA